MELARPERLSGQMVGCRLRCRMRAGGDRNRSSSRTTACCSARPWPGSARHETASPLRVGAPLRPVIGRRGRIGRRIRGRAPLSLFWRRRQPSRGSGPPQPSHMASWSLSLSLLQQIVLGLREPSRREAGAKAPPRSDRVGASRRRRRSGAPKRRASLRPSRAAALGSRRKAGECAGRESLAADGAVGGCRHADASDAGRPRAPVAAVSPIGSPIGRPDRDAARLQARLRRVERRPTDRRASRWRRSGPARHAIGAASAGPAGPTALRVGARRAQRCIGAAPAGPAGRRRAHRRVAGASHGGPVDPHRRLPAPRGHGRRCSGA